MALRGLFVALLLAFLAQGSLAATCVGSSTPAKYEMQCLKNNRKLCDCPTNYECTLGSKSNKYCQLATWCPSGYVCDDTSINNLQRCVPACPTDTKMAFNACYDDGEGSQTCGCPSNSYCQTYDPVLGSYCVTELLLTPGDQCVRNGKPIGTCAPSMTCTKGSRANKYCEGEVDD